MPRSRRRSCAALFSSLLPCFVFPRSLFYFSLSDQEEAAAPLVPLPLTNAVAPRALVGELPYQQQVRAAPCLLFLPSPRLPFLLPSLFLSETAAPPFFSSDTSSAIRDLFSGKICSVAAAPRRLLTAPCAPVSPAVASLSLRVALFLLLSSLCRLCLSVRGGPQPPPWMAVPRARALFAAAVARNRGRTTRSARSVRFPPTPSPGPPAVVFSFSMLRLLLLFLHKREQ